MKFRKKPVEVKVIDAWQWWPPSDSRHNPCMVSNITRGICPGDLYRHRTLSGEDDFRLRTIKGDLIVAPGDWIILRGIGDRILCDPDTFDVTYEAVEEAKECPGHYMGHSGRFIVVKGP